MLNATQKTLKNIRIKQEPPLAQLKNGKRWSLLMKSRQRKLPS